MIVTVFLAWIDVCALGFALLFTPAGRIVMAAIWLSVAVGWLVLVGPALLFARMVQVCVGRPR